MIRIVVAYDDNDSELAEYFEESYDDFLQSMQLAQETATVVLRGLECTEQNVNTAVVPINSNPFLFVGLSHGDNTGTYLLTENDTYVSPTNAVNFSNSFFYTTGCKVGLVLRENLLHHGCKVFVGYIDNSKVPLNEFYNYLFIDCELFALKKFLNTDSSIGELYNEMLSHTQIQIDWLIAIDEIVEAMDLQSNKDCLMLFGDSSVCRQDFQAY
ncbi:MAG: hypothetical protein ACOYOA_11760 [Saprospiraceae bacterium]